MKHFLKYVLTAALFMGSCQLVLGAEELIRGDVRLESTSPTLVFDGGAGNQYWLGADGELTIGTGIDKTAGEIVTLDNSGNLSVTTLDTGQGSNELYPMNQPVRTTDTPAFSGTVLRTMTAPVTPAEGTIYSDGSAPYYWTGAAWESMTATGMETDPIVGAITGLVKADGAGNISAAVAGVDYSTGVETDPVVGAVTGVVVGDGAGGIAAGTPGTDFEAAGTMTTHEGTYAHGDIATALQPGDDVSDLANDAGYLTAETDSVVGAVTGIVKANGAGVISAAAAGTDYYAPGSTDVALADGGTGVSLADPGSDQILFWDESDNAIDWLVPNTLLDVSANNLDVDLSELSTSTTDGDGDYFVVVDAANAQYKLTKANIALSGFNNDSSFLTANQAISLTGDVTGGPHATSIATTIAADSVALGTDTTGDYVATIADSGGSTITVTGSGSENAAVTLGITGDSIGDTQLAYNTGQALTTTSDPTFDDVTVDTLVVTGPAHNVTIDAAATANYNLVLPVDDGTAAQILSTDGSGNLSWVANAAGAVDDTAYGVGWDTDTTHAASKNALYDVISALPGGHDAVTLAADADTVLSLSTQEVGLDTQAANYVFAGPESGAVNDPTFRALVSADIPVLGASKITSETLTHERGGLEADVSAYTGLVGITGGATTEVDTAAELESVAGLGAFFSDYADDADATAMRSTLGLTIGTNVQAYSANLTTWAGKAAPGGVVVGTTDSQTLTNKSINCSNNTVTNLPLGSAVTGTLSVLNGGTGATDAPGAFSNIKQVATAVTTGVAAFDSNDFNISGGGSVTLKSGSVSLTGDVTGVLPVANGGTNSSTALSNDRVMVSNAGAIKESATITTTELGYLNGTTGTTGSGAIVLSTSPALTTPALGTPTSGTLTSCTNLPIVAGTTGTLSVARGGTGVTTSTGTGNTVLSASPTFTGDVTMPGTGIWNSSGNVGIGTATPDYKLKVVSSDGRGISVTSGGGTTPSKAISAVSNGAGITDNYGVYSVPYGGTNNYAFYGAPNSGTNDYGVYIAGSSVKNYFAGNVGIGTVNPTTELHAYSTGTSSIAVDAPAAQIVGFAYYKAGIQVWSTYVPASSEDLYFYKGDPKVTFKSDGKVGIGTITPTEQLHVVGDIYASGCVQSSGICGDYVFDDAYNLMPVEELKTYIGKNKHLPGMTINKGGKMSFNQAIHELLVKVEEQSRYIVELHERISELEKR